MRPLMLATIPWSVYNLKTYMENGTVSYTNSSQRGLKWDKRRKSKLIESVLNGIYINSFICNKTGEHFDVLDGKQRGNFLVDFVNDGFALFGECETTLKDGTEVDLVGQKFSDLDEELQQRIVNYNLEIYYYENLTEAEAADIIARANNGQPMTSVEKARIGSPSLAIYKKMGQHEMFDLILTPTSRNGSGDTEIIAKTWIMLYSDKKSFDKDVFSPVMQGVLISDEQQAEINQIYDYVVDVYNAILSKVETDDDEVTYKRFAKSVLGKKIHLLSLIPYFNEAINREISAEDFVNWLYDFYYNDDKKKASNNKKYNDNCIGGTGHETSIKNRDKVLKKSFDTTFAETPVEETESTDEIEREPVQE